jgi:hypothetical protein
MITSREMNTICEYNLPITSRQVSQLFGNCPKDVRQTIKEEKVVGIEPTTS